MNRKFKIFSLISLIGFLALTTGVYFVSAAHTSTITLNNPYAKASTSTTYIINVANAGADGVIQVVITKPAGYGDMACNAVGGWTPAGGVASPCTYTGGTIAAAGNKDFTVTLNTAATTGTFTWTVATTDNNASPVTHSYSPTSKVDAAAPITATVVAPANAARYKSGAVPATFTGAFADDASGLGLPINSGTIYIKDVTADKYWTGAAWSAAAASVTWLSTTHAATTDATSSTWTKSTNIPANGDYIDGHAYQVAAKAVDNAGNEFTGTPITYVFDTTRPSISSVAWSDLSGDKHINATDEMIITFSESMDTSTIDVMDADADLGLSNSHTFGTTGLGFSWTSNDTILAVTLGAGTTIVSGDTVNPAVTVLDVAGNTDNSTATAITDNLAPVLAESSTITGYALVPSYTFTTSEVGTIFYPHPEDCFSATTSATAGSNTIAFTVPVGTHYNCYIVVTDAVNNASIPLHVTMFTAGDPYQGSGSSNSTTTTTTTITDITPPTNTSIIVNGGATITTSTNVTLTLGAIDVAQMMISNDSSFIGASWEAYTTSKSWTLTAGNGSKTVYAKFRDSALNVSVIVSDMITYSPEAATQTATAPNTTISNLTLPYANPTTASEIAANKTALISFIVALLQSKQAVVSVSGIPSGFQFTTTLKQGITSNDIKYLQTFLNSDSSTAIGNSGKETSYFGVATKNAVGKFQIKYGLVTGTSDSGYGIVGPKTRAKINSLLGL
jgi:hypothetical protein